MPWAFRLGVFSSCSPSLLVGVRDSLSVVEVHRYILLCHFGYTLKCVTFWESKGTPRRDAMRANGDNNNTLNCSWKMGSVCLSKSVGEITPLCCIADMKFHNTSVYLSAELSGQKTEADPAHVDAYMLFLGDLCSICNASKLFDCSECSDVLTTLIQALLLT